MGQCAGRLPLLPVYEFIQSLAWHHMRPCTITSPLDYSLTPPDSLRCSHASSSAPGDPLPRPLMCPTGADVLGFLGSGTIHTLPAPVLESAASPQSPVTSLDSPRIPGLGARPYHWAVWFCSLSRSARFILPCLLMSTCCVYCEGESYFPFGKQNNPPSLSGLWPEPPSTKDGAGTLTVRRSASVCHSPQDGQSSHPAG